jgi:hypothetical protein
VADRLVVTNPVVASDPSGGAGMEWSVSAPYALNDLDASSYLDIAMRTKTVRVGSSFGYIFLAERILFPGYPNAALPVLAAPSAGVENRKVVLLGASTNGSFQLRDTFVSPQVDALAVQPPGAFYDLRYDYADLFDEGGPVELVARADTAPHTLLGLIQPRNAGGCDAGHDRVVRMDLPAVAAEVQSMIDVSRSFCPYEWHDNAHIFGCSRGRLRPGETHRYTVISNPHVETIFKLDFVSPRRPHPTTRHSAEIAVRAEKSFGGSDETLAPYQERPDDHPAYRHHAWTLQGYLVDVHAPAEAPTSPDGFVDYVVTATQLRRTLFRESHDDIEP